LPAALASPSYDGVLLAASRANAIKSKEYLLVVAIYISLLLVIYSLSRHLHQTTPLGSYREMQGKLLLAACASLALYGYFHGFYLLAAMLLVSAAGWYLDLRTVGDLSSRWTLWVPRYTRA
jgi:hypothetical protein